MSSHLRFLVPLLAAVLTTACAGSGSGRPDKGPTVLKIPQEDVPEEVRAIESQIDRKSGLVADEVEIHVSRNYEWDVSLTGDYVWPQRLAGDDHISVAEGHARATFRNLEIRGRKRIVFRKSGFDVVPFIKVTARGQAVHVQPDPGTGSPHIRRANVIKIENAEISFLSPGPESPSLAPVDSRAASGAVPRRVQQH